MEPNNTTSSVWVVLPAYNEESRIARTIDNLISCGYQDILVVDDGSKDATAQVASEKSVSVLRLCINRGQGAALRAGIQYLAEQKNPDIIVTFDADGQHHAEDISELTQPILQHKAEVVLGSRFLRASNKIPFSRRAILLAGVLFTRILSDIRVTDTHNGLRAFSRAAYTKIKINHRGMEHASEIIDEIKRNHLRFKEAPVTITYTSDSLQKGQPTSGFLKLGFKVMLRKLLL